MASRIFTAKFKTKVVLEALNEHCSVSELSQMYDLHMHQISSRI